MIFDQWCIKMSVLYRKIDELEEKIKTECVEKSLLDNALNEVESLREKNNSLHEKNDRLEEDTEILLKQLYLCYSKLEENFFNN